MHSAFGCKRENSLKQYHLCGPAKVMQQAIALLTKNTEMRPKEHLLVDIYFNGSFKSPSPCCRLYVIHRHGFYFWPGLFWTDFSVGLVHISTCSLYCSSEEQEAWSLAGLAFVCVHVVLMFVFSFLLSGYLDLVWHSQTQRAVAGEIRHSKDREHGTDLKITPTGLVRKIKMTEPKLRIKMKPIDVKAVGFVLKLALLVLFQCL